MSGFPDTGLCVLCRQRPIDPAYQPFCSERCRVQDLGRWIDGRYRVPAERPDEGAEPPDEDGRSDS
jgi:endogenous inhibitor of DNA gyrase (YacG/DUF329 family)